MVISIAFVPFAKARLTAAKVANASVRADCLASLCGAREWLFVVELMLLARHIQRVAPTFTAPAAGGGDAGEM